ncbi:MAG: hypothetical protein J7L14_03825 [Candidatus Diapherotrites archaeon]|nr:hypothetical protein [Candidatus Diapherotrites archaeon]
MVRWEWIYVKRGEPLDDGETITVDLPANEKVSAVMLDFSVTNYSTADDAPLLSAQVGTLEVIAEGRTILAAMGHGSASWAQFMDTKKKPYHDLAQTADYTQHVRYIVPFGKFLGDPQYGLDTANYSSVQFKLPWTYDSKYVSGSGSFDFLALRPADRAAVNFGGFIRRRDIYSFTTAASGDKEIELPLGMPYRRLALNTEDGTGISRVKLDVDSGRIIPIDLYWDELKALQYLLQPFPVAPGEEGPYQYVYAVLDESIHESFVTAGLSKLKLILTQNASGKSISVYLEEYGPTKLA